MTTMSKDNTEARDKRYRIIGILTTISGVVSGVSIVFLMLHVVLNVVGRHFFETPIPGTLEFSQYWYIAAIVFFGLAIAQRRDEHISAPILFDRLSPGLKTEFTIVGGGLTVLLLFAIAWWGWQEAAAQMALGATGTVSNIAIWPPRFFVTIGCVTFLLEYMFRIHATIEVARERSSSDVKNDAEGVK